MARTHLRMRRPEQGANSAIVAAVDRIGLARSRILVLVECAKVRILWCSRSPMKPTLCTIRFAALWIFLAQCFVVAGVPQPDFRLPDVNPNSPRYLHLVSPRDYRQQVSAYYFGQET